MRQPQPGSLLAFDFDSDVLLDHPQALAMMGPQFQMRSPAEFEQLLGQWRLTERGYCRSPIGPRSRRSVGTSRPSTAQSAVH
jgi:hypothetical protein